MPIPRRRLPAGTLSISTAPQAASTGKRKQPGSRATNRLARVPAVRHKIARPHPVTGQLALYAIAGTPFAVDGYAKDKSDALLAKLKDHAIQEKFIYRHRYEPGDVAIYDTSLTVHSGTPIDVADGPETQRLLWRISVKGRSGGY
jgi:taurine dioxygenase